MSLMSRVRDIDDVPTLAASADDNALERLKEHIQRFVSTDDIAASKDFRVAGLEGVVAAFRGDDAAL